MLVTGEDGNTYLAWTISNGAGNNMGNELWMSSYYSVNSEVREDYRASEEAWEEYDQQLASGAEPVSSAGERVESLSFEGWSDPVKVTDFA